MKIFDCTLRDGANVVGNGFSAELTESIIKNLLECGIKDIELGNAKGIGNYERGAVAPLDDKGYMKIASRYSADGNLGMFMLAQLCDPNKLALAKKYGLDFIRVGIAAPDAEKAADAIKAVKAAGLNCRVSLMKAYTCTADELAMKAKAVEEAGADAVTIMDSAGCMFPDEVTTYVKALKQQISIPVGFHGHSNLGLSQANALAAVAAGAEEVDGGLLGMARSAGNCATEIAAAVFARNGFLEGVDVFRLLEYLDCELIPEMEGYGYNPAVTPEALILGLSGCHSSFLPKFGMVAKEAGVSLYRLICEVSDIDNLAPSEELMRGTAEKLKESA